MPLVSIQSPALLEIRQAVRPWLNILPAHSKLLVGVSGGADSMALAIATLLESKAKSIQVIPVVVDHGLQNNSAEVAESVVSKLKIIGFDEVFCARAQVTMLDGIEASARRARYKIFHLALETYGAAHCFLGHTLDDQAETVLLGLARGSGTKSLAGMAEVTGPFIRPLLNIASTTTDVACLEFGVEFWVDPHNSNEEFLRVRVRKNILPIMEKNLGPGISSALARSARLLREDAVALDDWASEVFAGLDPRSLEIERLAELPKAVRSRVVRLAIYAAGAPRGSISADHLLPVEALVTNWHGQGAADLPGGVKVVRISGRLSLS
jgi:tRNA(Ile)-lysidine synthase